MRWISKATQLAIIAAAVVGFALLIRSGMPNPQAGGDFVTSAKFRDASRLQVGSPIIIAGVRVGDITGLTIEGRFARIDMRLTSRVKLPRDTFATRRTDSLFGDSYIELVLGDGDQTAWLRSGEPIAHVEEGGSTDQTLRSIARTLPKIDEALANAHQFMVDGRRAINGRIAEAVRDVDAWLAAGHIERPLASADRAMETFERGTTAAASAVAEAAPTIERRLASADQAIANARVRIGDARATVKEAFADARKRLDELDQPIADFAEVVDAIDRGHGDDWRGTLGKLVNDPSLANTLDDFTDGVAEGAAGLRRFHSWIGGRFEVTRGQARVYATAELATRTDKFYAIEFSYNSQGTPPAAELADAPGSPDHTRTIEIDNKLRFTAQFGKRIGFMRGRIGLKDSTPGIGVDALFFNGRLKLTADAFDSFGAVPRLKVAGALAVFRTIYILAGVDDALNAPGSLPVVTGNSDHPTALSSVRYGRNYFVGASLQFSDGDLATLLRFYGALVFGQALR